MTSVFCVLHRVRKTMELFCNQLSLCLTSGYIFCNINKFVFPNSQGSAATKLRFGEKYYLYFVENFMRFPAVKKLSKSVKISQSYGWLQSGSIFFWTWCINYATKRSVDLSSHFYKNSIKVQQLGQVRSGKVKRSDPVSSLSKPDITVQCQFFCSKYRWYKS